MLWVSVIVSECAELAVGLMAGWQLSGILFCAPLQPAQEGANHDRRARLYYYMMRCHSMSLRKATAETISAKGGQSDPQQVRVSQP